MAPQLRDVRSAALVQLAAAVARDATAVAVAARCAVALVRAVRTTAVEGDSPEGARIPLYFPAFARA